MSGRIASVRSGRVAVWRFGHRPSLSLTLAVILSGCGGSAPSPPPADSAATTPPAAAAETAKSSRTVSQEEATGTKWLGDIPYDVFYDRPLEVIGTAPELGENASAVAPVSSAPVTSRSTEAPSGPTNGNSSGSGAWARAISADVLDEEAKRIRTRLTQNLQTVATYNRSIDAVVTDAQVLAALAGVAERTGEEVRWKNRAAVIRQLAGDIYDAVGTPGGKAFREAKPSFETLLTAMDGGRVDVDAEEMASMADYAYRDSLMLRIESSFNFLRGSVATESSLKAQLDDVVREASVLAALGEVQRQPDYDASDEPNYVKYSDAFIAAAVAAREAAVEGNYDAYRAGVQGMETQCAACHGEYRNAGDGL